MTLLRAYDAQTGENYPGPTRWMGAFHAWLNAHGIEPTDTFRVEHHLIDAPFIRVSQYVKDENGRTKIDQEARKAITKTCDVLVTSEPPKVEDYL